MKNTLLVLLVMLALGACKKDDFESTPKIEFVDISPNFLPDGVFGPNNPANPRIILSVTDAEGDFGSSDPEDSSFIYLKNLQTGRRDSLRFPDLERAPKKDFKAEVSVSLASLVECFGTAPRPRVDTMYFEVYVTDSKNHKSNIITTTKPTMRECP